MHFGAGEAYAPVLEALGRLGHEGSGHSLIRVLERCAPMWLVQLPALVKPDDLERLQQQVLGATRDRMVRELNDALERLTAKHTLVLVLEDLHWSDVATVDLLISIAQRPEPARLLIVGTYRPAESVVNAPDFRTMVHELEGAGLCEHFALELLTPGNVATYVSARIGGESTEDIATTVYERSDGNALFMVNLLEHLIDANALRERDGRWVVDGASASLTQIPEGLRPFIERRLEALSDEERELLEVASVVGVQFTAAAVCAGLPHSGSEQGPERIETRLESLVSNAHMIEPCETIEWPDGTLTASYRFGHALYRDSLYEQLPEARRARLHRRVGERLQTAWGGDSWNVAGALAGHFERGRDPKKAAQYRRVAGERALGKHAYHEAAWHLQAALDAFDERRSGPADSEQEDAVRWELEVRTMLGAVLNVTRGHADPEVKKVQSRARLLIDRVDDPVAQLQSLFSMWTFSTAAGELGESAQLVTRMLELTAATENDELVLMPHSARARTCFLRAEFAESADSVQQVLTLYDPLRHGDLPKHYGHDEPAVISQGVDGWRLWLQGYPAQAATRLREACELAERLDTPWGRAFAWAWLLVLLQFRGDAAELYRRAGDLHRVSAEHGFSLWIAWATFFEGWVAGARANKADGITLMERGLDAWRDTGAHIIEPYFLALLSETCLRAGRMDAAGEWLAEAVARVEKSGERWWEAELHRLQGELLLAAAGDGARGDQAEACFRRALEVAGGQGATSLELRAALSLSRLGRSPDAHQLLSEVAGRFTEGHDTVDLRAAQTQLSLNDPPADD
jgi:predicted ATPase